MKKTVILAAVLGFFVSINVFLYTALTCRLGNNYSGGSQTKMVDWLLSAEGQKLIESCGYVAIGEKNNTINRVKLNVKPMNEGCV